VDEVGKRTQLIREKRRQQIADTTLKLVAKHGVDGATISRIAAGVGLSRAALYKYFPNREAMLEAALDLLIERAPRWIPRCSGDNVLERLMEMGDQFGPLGVSVFESFTHPWFQFAAASGAGKLTEQLGQRHLVFVRDLVALIEQGKRDGSIRVDADSDLIAWGLMMWAWATDVARLVGLEEVLGSERAVAIFRRLLGDIAPSDSTDLSSDVQGGHPN
jgi:AcrR family transcriptional regulator